MESIPELKKEIAKLKKQRKWLTILLDFSVDWVGTCGCVKMRGFIPDSPEKAWVDKSSNLLNFLEEEELNGR